MSSFNILGISGKKCNGKTYIANTIMATRSDVIQCNFADGLKEEVSEFLVNTPSYTALEKLIDMFGEQEGNAIWNMVYSWPHVDPQGRSKLGVRHFYHIGYGREDAKQKIKDILNTDNPEKENYRMLMQYWGTEYRRKSDDNYWINKFIKKMNELKESGKYKYAICCDMRFPNEYDTIKSLDGKTIRVIRPSIGWTGDHPSETSLDLKSVDDWDCILVNDDTTEFKENILLMFQNFDTEGIINGRDLGDEN
ncbi:MAG TPA: hypothetical protein VKR58_05835 [Aquella sp.]|nr:hypothetical protein [Aquella sp.]